ncbi:MAG: SPOR domain-containing protein [Kiloniellaceae bacterium]
MTLHEVSPARALLARKGCAVPAGKRRPPIERSEPELAGGAGDDAGDEPVQLAFISDGEAKDAAIREAEPVAAASLLPFNLFRKTLRATDSLDLPEAEPATSIEPPSDTPADAPAAPHASAAAMPSPTPGWRVGIDSMPREPRANRWLWPAAVLVGCAAVAAIAWVSFQAQGPDPGGRAAQVAGAGTGLAAREAPAQAAVEGPLGAAAPDAGAEPEVPGEVPAAVAAETAPAPEAAEPVEPAGAPPAAEPAPAAEPVPERLGKVPEPAAAAAAPAETEPSGTEPSVDVVRIDPDGAAVIAGRAAPGSELIVLHNGTPIGTAIADAFGEWVFIPDAPLPPGAHEFGLVVKAVRGRVTVPAPKKAIEDPGAEETGADQTGAEETGTGQTGAADTEPADTEPGAGRTGWSAPVPARKPNVTPARPPSGGARATTGPGEADFVVQLASVKTHAGAAREWRKLKRRFPGILAGMKLKLYKTKLAGRGTVIRVRTGPFTERREAANFCALFRAERQECLVVRTATRG